MIYIRYTVAKTEATLGGHTETLNLTVLHCASCQRYANWQIGSPNTAEGSDLICK